MPRSMITPGFEVGTMIWAILPGPFSSMDSLTRHITMKKSAASPLEVNHLCPLTTHSSPSRIAVV